MKVPTLFFLFFVFFFAYFVVLFLKGNEKHTKCENRYFHGFSTFDMDKIGKICQHHWTEYLNISQIAKSESDMS